jgi:hypothetical protein
MLRNVDRALDEWINMLVGMLIAVSVWIAIFSLVPR